MYKFTSTSYRFFQTISKSLYAPWIQQNTLHGSWTKNSHVRNFYSSPPFYTSLHANQPINLEEKPFQSENETTPQTESLSSIESTLDISSDKFDSSIPATTTLTTTTTTTTTTSAATTATSTEDEELPDLNWFLDPPPEHPPRWLPTTSSITVLKDTSPASLKEFLESERTTDIVVLDLQPLGGIYDTMIVATAMHPGHLRSIRRNLKTVLKQPSHIEKSAEWVAIDLDRTVVHIFTPESRAHYSIDTFWQFMLDSTEANVEAVLRKEEDVEEVSSI